MYGFQTLVQNCPEAIHLLGNSCIKNSYISLTTDPFNTKLWDFAIYSVIFLLIIVKIRNYKN